MISTVSMVLTTLTDYRTVLRSLMPQRHSKYKTNTAAATSEPMPKRRDVATYPCRLHWNHAFSSGLGMGGGFIIIFVLLELLSIEIRRVCHAWYDRATT